MTGKLKYKVEDGYRLKELDLTVCNEEELENNSISEVRRKRIIRLLREAEEQGCLLTYRDLKLILLTSSATIKRDISYLRKQGMEIPVKRQ